MENKEYVVLKEEPRKDNAAKAIHPAAPVRTASRRLPVKRRTASAADDVRAQQNASQQNQGQGSVSLSYTGKSAKAPAHTAPSHGSAPKPSFEAFSAPAGTPSASRFDAAGSSAPKSFPDSAPAPEFTAIREDPRKKDTLPAEEFAPAKTGTDRTAPEFAAVKDESPARRSAPRRENLRKPVKKASAGEKKAAPAAPVHATAPSRNAAPEKLTAKTVWKRIGLCVATFFGLLILAVVLVCNTLLNGPSESIRNQLVLSAKQASATKWLPGIFMDDDLVNQIERDSKKVSYDIVSIDDVASSGDDAKEDEWAQAVDGIIFKTITMPTCKAYLMIIRDPSRVFVGTSSDYHSGKAGARIFDIAEKYQAVAAINGGEFNDAGGVGSGDNPMGVTFSQGVSVWSDGLTNRTFIGIDKENKLVVSEGMTLDRANSIGIRDGVCFQKGNILITNDGTNLTMHYANGDTGTAQRTAIGQRADGAVIFLVTDGRTASSIGATHNDLIDVMVQYGAVTAAKLDGGSSAMMYYRDYFNTYHYDLSTLDEYQRQGLVNKYKAFTAPRRIPTYFVVGGQTDEK